MCVVYVFNLQDLNLVFNNCYLYNEEEHDVYKMCKSVEEKTRALLLKKPTEVA